MVCPEEKKGVQEERGVVGQPCCFAPALLGHQLHQLQFHCESTTAVHHVNMDIYLVIVGLICWEIGRQTNRLDHLTRHVEVY